MASLHPPIIYGTAWKKEQTTELVHKALKSGFRAIDTACQPRHYREDLVGEGIQRALAAGDLSRREDLFIQTKFSPPDCHDDDNAPYSFTASIPEMVEASLKTSLTNLRVTYIDSWVLHSMFPKISDTVAAWSAMESAVTNGIVRQIGISNCYDLDQFQTLYHGAKVKPSVLQNRFYSDSGYDKPLREFCMTSGVQYQSFWSLTANPTALGHAVMGEVGKFLRAEAVRSGLIPKHATVTREQAFYRCLMDMGITPLSGTTSEHHMRDDVLVPKMAHVPQPLLVNLATKVLL